MNPIEVLKVLLYKRTAKKTVKFGSAIWMSIVLASCSEVIDSVEEAVNDGDSQEEVADNEDSQEDVVDNEDSQEENDDSNAETLICKASELVLQEGECNQVSLTQADAISNQSGNIEVQQEFGADVLTLGNGEFMTLKREGCYDFGGEGEDFSISFWLKPGDWGESNNYIMGNRRAYTSDPGFFVHAFANGDGFARIAVNNAFLLDQSRKQNLESVNIKVQEWSLIVLSYSYNNGDPKFTVYANSIGNSARATLAPFGEDSEFKIGGDGNIDTGEFEISEVTLYKEALTQDQVSLLQLNNERSAEDSEFLSAAIGSINNHIIGNTSLSDSNLIELADEIDKYQTAIIADEDNITNLLELIKNYEEKHGALFTTSETVKGFSRYSESDNLTLERTMFRIQQLAHDRVFSSALMNNNQCRKLLEGKKYQSSDFFPGSVDAPVDSSVSFQVNIDATLKKYWGMRIAFADEDARRPTGTYLAPGSIAKVTVPESMVNEGFSVLVGAHTVDHQGKPYLKRFDRVFKKFPIESTETYISNPFGGGIYINVPYLSDLGIQTIELENVLQAPFYSTKEENKTTLTQWQSRRDAPGLWADFETDNFMMQVPRDWVYMMENPQPLMERWAAIMDGMTELKGMEPEQRNRKVLYLNVDARAMHDGFNGIGYPQANITYGPNSSELGRSSHKLLTDPGATSTMASTTIHELTHAEAIFGFGGSEVEAIAYFPATYIRSEKLGYSLDEAIKDGTGQGQNEAAVNWMVTPNFRAGLEMDRSGRPTDETRYQRRGYMKYVDIAVLFGWDAIKAYYKNMNERAEMGIQDETEGLTRTDFIMLQHSRYAGADLRPLFHFWGRHPEDNDALGAKMLAEGLQVSEVVKDHLNHYVSIAPKNNAEFAEHHEVIYPGKPNNFGDYGQNMYTELADLYDESTYQEIQTVVSDIIDLYY